MAGFYSVSTKDGKTTAYRDGAAVSSYDNTAAAPSQRPRRPRPSNPLVFVGSKLKIERAKHHIGDLEAALNAFFDRQPYELIHEVDPNTSENVYRVLTKEDIPVVFSGFLGDAIHNIRCVFDYLVCDLIRANGKEPNGGSNLPIDKRPKRNKPGSIGKINGVSRKAEALILALKASKRRNSILYAIHMLDVFDKHNRITPVAAATLQISARIGVPGIFLGPVGGAAGTGPGPGGSTPWMIDAGTPAQFRRVPLTQADTEIYRSPSGFNEEVQAAVTITFGKGEVVEGEPIVETLRQFVEFTEGTLGIFERRGL